MFDLDDVFELVLDVLGDVIEEVLMDRRRQAKPKPKLNRPKKENPRKPDEEPWERKEEQPPWEK